MQLPKINIPPYLRNKYILSFVIFIVWLGFFDANNLVHKLKLSNRIEELEQQKEHYIAEINQNQRKLQEIQENAESLEKFAREQYLMKKKNEDIFIIIEE